jgi:hypothetical protein
MNFKFWEWNNSPEVMVVPFLRDIGDWRKADLVKAQHQKCAQQLASHLFRWERQFPSLSTIKTWNIAEKKFLGMDLSLFINFIQNHYSIRTADHHEWLLDRIIGDRIFAACIAEDSPLPPANWDVERERKKAA